MKCMANVMMTKRINLLYRPTPHMYFWLVAEFALTEKQEFQMENEDDSSVSPDMTEEYDA